MHFVDPDDERTRHQLLDIRLPLCLRLVQLCLRVLELHLELLLDKHLMLSQLHMQK